MKESKKLCKNLRNSRYGEYIKYRNTANSNLTFEEYLNKNTKQ